MQEEMLQATLMLGPPPKSMSGDPELKHRAVLDQVAVSTISTLQAAYASVPLRTKPNCGDTSDVSNLMTKDGVVCSVDMHAKA